jgi:hypothetical protein
VIRKTLLILFGLFAALVAALLLWPRWPTTVDQVAEASLVTWRTRDSLAALCVAGVPFAPAELKAAGIEPRFRPTVLRQEMVSRDGKNVVMERREPTQRIDEITIRIDSPQRVALTLALPEIRAGFKPFDDVSIAKGSMIVLVGECKERMLHWVPDRASTTVPARYLPASMR